MKTYNNRKVLLSAIMSCFPLLAIAQTSAPVVPPPQPPSGVTSKSSGQLSLAPIDIPLPAAPTAPASVAPPQKLNNSNLIDIAIPEAPKPTSLNVKETLTPAVPAPKETAKKKPKESKEAKAVAKKDASAHEDTHTVTAKLPQDPFAGIRGTPVSDSQLNRFVFPEAIEGVFFQEGAPLPDCPNDARAQDPCKPVFLNGRRVMLLQLRAGARGPVQMLVHLASGRIETLNLMPAAGPGSIIRIDGAEDGPSDTRLAEAKAAMGAPASGLMASEQNVDLLSRFARGDIPAGFEARKAGKPVRYELFDVTPMAMWRNSLGHRVTMLQVYARDARPVAINEGLFRQPNVKAIALDKNTITDKAPATLYLLEQEEAR